MIAVNPFYAKRAAPAPTASCEPPVTASQVLGGLQKLLSSMGKLASVTHLRKRWARGRKPTPEQRQLMQAGLVVGLGAGPFILCWVPFKSIKTNVWGAAPEGLQKFSFPAEDTRISCKWAGKKGDFNPTQFACVELKMSDGTALLMKEMADEA